MGTLDTLDVLYTINSALALTIFVLWCHITHNQFGNIANLSCEVAARIGRVGGASRLTR